MWTMKTMIPESEQNANKPDFQCCALFLKLFFHGVFNKNCS